MASNRIISAGDASLGEPEQDANSALTDLDKGLRSGNVGEQCEAIVKFPRLFEKYPFPILINSSFLKLADVFRVGNNFMRVWVLRVCQQSEKHLDKILSIDDFVRRIFGVIHSNDPIARALTLHVMGSVASIIPEREQVHHSIRNSLDSHDTVEVLAAVYAASKFAAHSRTFAVSMCNKIAGMIKGLDTPAELKLRLIPVLQHMHYSTSTAAMVRELGGELLQSYPANEFLLTSLDTLTKLAKEALVDIPHQVSLLLYSLEGEPRVAVQKHIFWELKILAKEGATHWTAASVAALVAKAQTYLSNPNRKRLLVAALDALVVLSQSASTCHEQMHPESGLIDLCIQSSSALEPQIVSKALTILTNINCHCYNAGLPQLPNDDALELALESFMMFLMIQDNEKFLPQLKTCLKCMVQLCEACPHRCHFFVELISEQILCKKGNTLFLLVETLAAMACCAPIVNEKPLLLGILPDISRLIEGFSKDEKRGSLLCTLVLQTCQGYSIPQDVQKCLYDYSQKCQVWECYKLTRASMRFGQHMFAVPSISRLIHYVSSESLHFWLSCLKDVSLAECALMNEKPVNSDGGHLSLSREKQPGLLESLSSASIHYSKAIAAIKAAGSSHQSLQFAADYLRLRLDFLQCMSQLVQSCNSLYHPPPAIAMNQAQVCNDEFLRHGRTTTQLRKCATEFRTIADNYHKLAQCAFDADPKSLANVKVLKNICLMMAQSIECLVFTNHQDKDLVDFGSTKDCPELHHLVTSSKRAMQIIEDLKNDTNSKPITSKHTNALLRQVKIVTVSPLCLPRYFFQTLQCTSVKLSITPQARLVGEITVPANTQMVVHIEGVCQHLGTPGLFRSIKGIDLVLTNTFQSSRGPDSNKEVGSMNQVVNPHHDFFSAQFLLSFPQGGQYQICITASIVDEEGLVWRSGPKSYLVVKVYDEPGAGGSSGSIQALNKGFSESGGGNVGMRAPRF
ncbi:integrator complex subunit 7 [Neocloeon triangulifer]|uniref:integrator complex subunit 7 n=1 Tax=Neocloeon triangulifer TaxID=2078957 RepID=UPI00286EF9F9|nr:integrator complex subunit 7 [Neocloeon triangulifer]XP_059475106.1 integrator complex subunit 7 [Neocloeon triangulifer]